ncbi:MAG TPA: hypothetical protein VK479_08650 [Micropepsaceae bacterium]|nr:hypothetical protein [Micropepsaceae bacterium]
MVTIRHSGFSFKQNRPDFEMFHERRWLGTREEVLHFDIKIGER